IVASHARQDELSAFGGVRRCVGDRPAEFFGPGLRLRACPVEDGHIVPCPRQVTRHRITHHAQSNESNAGHSITSALVPGARWTFFIIITTASAGSEMKNMKRKSLA